MIRAIPIFAALLNAAEARKTIQCMSNYPNKRTATMLLALSGWQMNEITAPANEVIQITVQGKQNKSHGNGRAVCRRRIISI